MAAGTLLVVATAGQEEGLRVSTQRRNAKRPGKAIIAAVAAMLVAVVLAVVLLQPADDSVRTPPEGGDRVAKNVVLLIGDGMGAAHRELGRLSSVGMDGELAMNKLPAAGLVHTTSTEPVTDSAAAGTAIATGVKTNNGAVGVDENGDEVRSVLDLARQAGKATGLVTTTLITDATPASFGASVADRGDHEEIARQYAESDIDLLLGGGADVWYEEGSEDGGGEDGSEGSGSDQSNLIELARDNGYAVVESAEELERADDGKLLGLLADERMYEPAAEGEGDEYSPVVSVADMTRTAIERLSDDDDGFFLVVEEEAIDEFAHENNAERTAQAVAALDAAVEVAMDFAEDNPETLVIVAADHETGGLGIKRVNPDDTDEDGPNAVADSDEEFNVDWVATGHTAEDVPITAAGPGSTAFEGVMDNTEVFDGMVAAMRLEE